MARTKHTAKKSTGYEREQMNESDSNDDDSSDLDKKSSEDKRKQTDELSDYYSFIFNMMYPPRPPPNQPLYFYITVSQL